MMSQILWKEPFFYEIDISLEKKVFKWITLTARCLCSFLGKLTRFVKKNEKYKKQNTSVFNEMLRLSAFHSTE
jgi:hypothetical protein